MSYPVLPLIGRSPAFTIQLQQFGNKQHGGRTETRILVGLDMMESYTLGPYDGTLDFVDALKLVTADIALEDRYGMRAAMAGRARG